MDQLHELIDELEGELEVLNGYSDKNIEVSPAHFSGIIETAFLLSDGVGYGSALESLLRVPAPMINKITRNYRSMRVGDLYTIAEKMRASLRSIEGEIAAQTHETLDRKDEEGPIDVPKTTGTAIGTIGPLMAQASATVGYPKVVASRWVFLSETKSTKDLIKGISASLDQIIMISKGSNLPPDQASLTAIEKAELIAVLETALQMLKAPMVEEGLIKKLMKLLKGTIQRNAENSTDSAISQLSKETLRMLRTLFDSLPLS